MKKLVIYKYYLYGFLISMRLTRIVNILYLVKYANIDLVKFAFLSSVSFLTSAVMMILYPILGAGAEFIGMGGSLIIISIVIIMLLVIGCKLYTKIVGEVI